MKSEFWLVLGILIFAHTKKLLSMNQAVAYGKLNPFILLLSFLKYSIFATASLWNTQITAIYSRKSQLTRSNSNIFMKMKSGVYSFKSYEALKHYMTSKYSTEILRVLIYSSTRTVRPN